MKVCFYDKESSHTEEHKNNICNEKEEKKGRTVCDPGPIHCWIWEKEIHIKEVGAFA